MTTRPRVAFTERQAAALAGAPDAARRRSRPAGVRLVAGDVTGLARCARSPAPSAPRRRRHAPDADCVDLPGLDALVDELDAAGNGVVMTMGKGGVGKTTLAAAIARRARGPRP